MADFKSPTIITKAPHTQIRIQASEYQNVTRLDIREYKQFGGSKEFKPTKNGLSIPQELFELFMTGCQKHGKELPRRVVDTPEGVRFVIGKTAEDAIFHKTRLYLTEEEGRSKTPPDGYALFKVKIDQGTVVKQKRLANRKNKKWKDVE